MQIKEVQTIASVSCVSLERLSRDVMMFEKAQRAARESKSPISTLGTFPKSVCDEQPLASSCAPSAPPPLIASAWPLVAFGSRRGKRLQQCELLAHLVA